FDGRLNASLRLPRMEKDFVFYIAQSPAKPEELAIATRRKNVFLSRDAGKNWRQIAREGEGL
ncbi:MAG: F510_1955 family glycosylhydrolase, partial [Burkholderiales bacterium]